MAKIGELHYIVCAGIIIVAVVLSVILKTAVFKMPDESAIRANAEEYLSSKYDNEFLYGYEITSIDRDYGYNGEPDSWVVRAYAKEHIGFSYYELYYDYIGGDLIREYVERQYDDDE